ncbi:DUF5999 family protein [Streptosporangium sp. NPDC048865]|uniref:DUF5999 family protein n=1 Tax=Streptosporangium sp. NPDC048865 TaxID=3155766 RepID=UPI003419D89D
MCPHETPCPSAYVPGREAARPIASHPEQGWSLLCNGVVLFEDTGELLPDGRIVPPHRPPAGSVVLLPAPPTAQPAMAASASRSWP